MYQLQELIPAFITADAESKVIDTAKEYASDLPFHLEVVRSEVEMWASAIRRSGRTDTSIFSLIGGRGAWAWNVS